LKEDEYKPKTFTLQVKEKGIWINKRTWHKDSTLENQIRLMKISTTYSNPRDFEWRIIEVKK